MKENYEVKTKILLKMKNEVSERIVKIIPLFNSKETEERVRIKALDYKINSKTVSDFISNPLLQDMEINELRKIIFREKLFKFIAIAENAPEKRFLEYFSLIHKIVDLKDRNKKEIVKTPEEKMMTIEGNKDRLKELEDFLCLSFNEQESFHNRKNLRNIAKTIAMYPEFLMEESNLGKLLEKANPYNFSAVDYRGYLNSLSVRRGYDSDIYKTFKDLVNNHISITIALKRVTENNFFQEELELFRAKFLDITLQNSSCESIKEVAAEIKKRSYLGITRRLKDEFLNNAGDEIKTANILAKLFPDVFIKNEPSMAN